MTVKLEKFPICKVTIGGIGKALRVIASFSIEQPRDRLSVQIKDFAHLSANDMEAYDIPPSRGVFDHAIESRKEDRKSSTSPWGLSTKCHERSCLS